MNTKKILFSIAIACFVLTGCKSEAKKEVKKETVAANKQKVSLAISGMTCEIGCAKTIQSKLSKKEGVLDAKVIFTDSIANIEFDANTTSKKDLIAFVDGIAGGDLYKASEATKMASTSKECAKPCKKECDSKKECSEACKKECAAKKAANKQCKEDCKMACCADNKAEKKECKEDCKKECCNKKTA